eukprot:TRINITY_DN22350_c0_g1_i1.p1 TRINITY_DN22350_c0_g1~~TRINITY_DN22350_c0_g1_i1.p1  ORF type:complete len:499 (+),score=189.47 TRINITY_DN22350_c0_g1_i1:108-1604(+)
MASLAVLAAVGAEVGVGEALLKLSKVALAEKGHPHAPVGKAGPARPAKRPLGFVPDYISGEPVTKPKQKRERVGDGKDALDAFNSDLAARKKKERALQKARINKIQDLQVKIERDREALEQRKQRARQEDEDAQKQREEQLRQRREEEERLRAERMSKLNVRSDLNSNKPMHIAMEERYNRAVDAAMEEQRGKLREIRQKFERGPQRQELMEHEQRFIQDMKLREECHRKELKDQIARQERDYLQYKKERELAGKALQRAEEEDRQRRQQRPKGPPQSSSGLTSMGAANASGDAAAASPQKSPRRKPVVPRRRKKTKNSDGSGSGGSGSTNSQGEVATPLAPQPPPAPHANTPRRPTSATQMRKVGNQYLAELRAPGVVKRNSDGTPFHQPPPRRTSDAAAKEQQQRNKRGNDYMNEARKHLARNEDGSPATRRPSHADPDHLRPLRQKVKRLDRVIASELAKAPSGAVGPEDLVLEQKNAMAAVDALRAKLELLQKL